MQRWSKGSKLSKLFQQADQLHQWLHDIDPQTENLPFILRLRSQLTSISPLISLNIVCLSGALAFELHSSIWYLYCSFLTLLGASVTSKLLFPSRSSVFAIPFSETSTMTTFVAIQLLHTGLLSLHTVSAPAKERAVSRHLEGFFTFYMINLGVLWAILPCPLPRRLPFMWPLLACAVSETFRHAGLLGGNIIVWLLRGPVTLLCSGLLTYGIALAALRHSLEREKTMGDLRLALDEGIELSHLVDVKAISRAWVEGPLVHANFLVAVTEMILMLFDALIGEYSARLRILPKTLPLLLLLFGPGLLGCNHGKRRASVSKHLVYMVPVVLLIRTIWMVWEIKCTAEEEFFCAASGGGPDLRRSTAFRMTPTTDLGPDGMATHFLGLTPREQEWSAEPLLDMSRGLLVATLPCSKAQRQWILLLLIVSLLTRDIRREMISDEGTAIPARLFYLTRATVTTILAGAIAHFSLHEALAACWQRKLIMEELELNRRAQLSLLLTRRLRRDIARRDAIEPAEATAKEGSTAYANAGRVAFAGMEPTNARTTPLLPSSFASTHVDGGPSIMAATIDGPCSSSLGLSSLLEATAENSLSSEASRRAEGGSVEDPMSASRDTSPSEAECENVPLESDSSASSIALEHARGTSLAPNGLPRVTSTPSFPGSCFPFMSGMLESDNEADDTMQEQVILLREHTFASPQSHWLTDLLFNKDLVESLLLYMIVALCVTFFVAVHEALG